MVGMSTSKEKEIRPAPAPLQSVAKPQLILMDQHQTGEDEKVTLRIPSSEKTMERNPEFVNLIVRILLYVSLPTNVTLQK